MGELGEAGGGYKAADVEYFGLLGDTDEVRGALVKH